MKASRNIGLDVARVIALACIMCCHFCSVYWNGFAVVAHDVLAVMGNSLFFAISGYLLGRKWEAEGCPLYGIGFVAKRIKRLYPPFAMFVIFYVIVLMIKGHYLSVVQIAMNLGMLSWFVKLPGAGHLWFVTAMMLLYVLYMSASRIRCVRGGNKELIVLCGLIAAVILAFILRYVGFRQSYFIVFASGAIATFLYGGRNWGLFRFKGLCIAVGIVGLCILHKQEMLCVAIAVMVALVIIACCANVPAFAGCACITWLSSISYEMYLVHCIFQNSTVFNFKDFFGNVWLFAVNYVACSIIAAMALKKLCAMLMSSFNVKRGKRV